METTGGGAAISDRRFSYPALRQTDSAKPKIKTDRLKQAESVFGYQIEQKVVAALLRMEVLSPPSLFFSYCLNLWTSGRPKDKFP